MRKNATRTSNARWTFMACALAFGLGAILFAVLRTDSRESLKITRSKPGEKTAGPARADSADRSSTPSDEKRPQPEPAHPEVAPAEKGGTASIEHLPEAQGLDQSDAGQARFEIRPRPGKTVAQTLEELPWTERVEEMPRYEHVPNQLFVKFRAEIPEAVRGKIVANVLGGRVEKDWSRESGRTGAGTWVQVQLPASLSVADALKQLREETSVAYAEPNYVQHAYRTPNDPFFNLLYGLHNTGQTGGTADADIDAPEAWDLTTGEDVLVAVIDTGIDYNHPDLRANLWRNAAEANGRPGVDDDRNGLVDDIYGYDFANRDADPMDDQGHGTHVAGTIGAVGNNGVGVSGVAWRVKMMAMKFLGANGGTTSGAIEAIDYARRAGARIMNNSWGGGGFSQALADAIAAADAQGILFLAAAGNAANDNDANPSYPASYQIPNVIAVANGTHLDRLYDDPQSGSNYGARSVHLAAPGTQIGSTYPSNRYVYLTGTSMACPHVSGAAAMVWSMNLSLRMDQVRAAILNHVDRIPALEGRVATGGRLNVRRAVESVRQAPVRLAYSSHAIVDDGSAGTVGNRDGAAGAGERVRIRVTVENRGTAAASAASAVLSSADAGVRVLSATDSFGDVAPGARVVGAAGFLVEIDPSVASGTMLDFRLALRAANQAEEAFVFAVRVTAASEISGRVVDARTGAPLAGATISYRGPEAGSATSDANGGYRLSGLRQGTWVLAAATDGYAPSVERSVTVPPSRASVDFNLVRLAAIAGSLFRTSDGVLEPLPGLAVNLSGPENRRAVSAADGSFRFARLMPGRYVVTPEGGAFAPAQRTVDLNGLDVVGQDFSVAAAAPVAGYTRFEVPPLAIPDADEFGAWSGLDFPEARTMESVRIHVRIRHTFRGDLRVVLYAPSGNGAILHDQTGGGAPDLDAWYDASAIFAGESSGGTWWLLVQDLAAQDTGELEEWTVEVSGR